MLTCKHTKGPSQAEEEGMVDSSSIVEEAEVAMEDTNKRER